MFKFAVVLVVFMSVGLSIQESSNQQDYITVKFVPTILKSSVPDIQDGLTKIFKQYGYEPVGSVGFPYGAKLSNIQEMHLPIGAGVKGEDIIMEAFGLDKFNGNNKTNSD